ncbi:MAG TPA: hypothetical protein PKW95_06200 [bacterium]|nr:hypothetical protein [bacterium]
MKQTTAMILLTLMLATAIGCGALDNGDAEDVEKTYDGSGVGVPATIYELQRGRVAAETRVLLSHVIVTTPLTDYGDGFFVQEMEGGPYSGIYVYVTGEASGEIRPEVGDVVDIAGLYDEYYELSELTVSAIGDMEVLDNLGSPDPEVVDARDLATGSDEAEKWEGVLVRVEDVQVTEPDLGWNEFEISGGAIVDDLFWPPESAFIPPDDAQFDSITGAFTYTFEEYKICPRSAADFDGDWEPVGPLGEATIYEIQQGDVPLGATVTVTAVISSPLNFNGDTFFIMEESGGPWSGVAVYMYDEVAAVYNGQVGDAVEVTAQVTEYYDLTELVVKDPGDLVLLNEGQAPDAEEIDLDDVGEKWEGVLVQTGAVTVSEAVNNYGEFTVGDGNGELVVDDLFFEKYHWETYGIEAGDTFGRIRGILTYDYGEFKLEPRTDSDLSD